MRQYCASGRERDAGRLYESGYGKRMKKKKMVLNGCLVFHCQKARNNARTARHCKTRMKSNIVSIGSYVWWFLQDFPQTEVAC